MVHVNHTKLYWLCSYHGYGKFRRWMPKSESVCLGRCNIGLPLKPWGLNRYIYIYIYIYMFLYSIMASLEWCHNERDSVSDHQPHVCLLNRLFRRRSKKTPQFRVTGLCVGNSPVTAGEFPTQKASNAENVSISWRHHVRTNTELGDKTNIAGALLDVMCQWSGSELPCMRIASSTNIWRNRAKN